MRRGKVLFFLILFLGLGSCAKQTLVRPQPPTPLDLPPALYLDLRQPIYLIADPSFFSGCEKESFGPKLCQAERMDTMRSGINDWFGHFYGPFRPRAYIMRSYAGIPVDVANRPIHLRIKKGFCDQHAPGSTSWACYYYPANSDPFIVFDSAIRITSRIAAHEFGHALGCGHNEEPEGGRSVMRSLPDSDVMPVDLKIFCQIHKECPAHEEKW